MKKIYANAKKHHRRVVLWQAHNAVIIPYIRCMIPYIIPYIGDQ